MQPSPPYKVFIGFDANELRACNVAYHSLFAHTDRSEVTWDRISLTTLGYAYTRSTSRLPNGQLFDEISDAPMSTEHAIARFFVPFLCRYQGWALFVDGDVLFRADVRELFALADDRYAVQVVQHPPLIEEGQKKAGQIQQAYPRKNWSSVILWNCGHPLNRYLTVDVLNRWTGRDLHAFGWLGDELIGSLPARWNFLTPANPAIVHFTLGTPDLPGHESSAYADEWIATAKRAGYDLAQPIEKGAP